MRVAPTILRTTSRLLFAAGLSLVPAWASAETPAAPIAAPVAAPPAAPPTVTVHASAMAALNSVIAELPQKKGAPLVLALGEYHETNADASKRTKVPSALKRFSEQLLPVLATQSSDLILETWITDGNCGKQETAAVQDVQKTTQRPQKTEDELVTLVKQAKAAGVQPHILKLSCDDYKSLTASGEVDYEKLLKLVTELLQKKIVDVTRRRERDGGSRHVLVYGGALHNDLAPKAELAAFSYGPAMQKEFSAGFVELDLYVPEFVDRDDSMKQEPWYPLYKKRAKPGQTVLVRRGPGSYILLFPRAGR